METKKMPKNANFYCNLCDFKCFKQSNWQKHVQTRKHLYGHTGNKMEILEMGKNAEFVCNCGKEFATNSGLWKHAKKCQVVAQVADDKPSNNENSDLITYLMSENAELKTLILDIAKKESYNNCNNNSHNTNNNNTTNNNSNNKSFNLQFFLNETCKDAMNIMDFVESIQFQLSDLESVGEKGYIEGISDIIIKNLKNLDVTQRPVHCTDKKRETIYVKDDDKWEKDEENKKMHKMVRKVQDKNFRMIKKFKEKYPDYHKASSKHSDAYNNIIIESMGGRGDNDFEKEEKIIKKVSKEVTVNKLSN
jgi:hypothetical protein